MEKDLYLYGLPVMVDDILIHVTAMDIQTAFSRYQYLVPHKEGKSTFFKNNYSFLKVFKSPLNFTKKFPNMVP